jgi:hypothetical protein
MSGKGLYKKAVEYMMHRQVSMVITESGSQGTRTKERPFYINIYIHYYKK